LTQKKRHTRNPIKQYGRKPTEQFVIVTLALLRDSSISSDAFRVHTLFATHEPGYEGSMKRYGSGMAGGSARSKTR
jgi:hypothetical protein